MLPCLVSVSKSLWYFRLLSCHHATPFGQKEPENASELCTTTDAAKEKLDNFFKVGHGACASLHISKASELPAMDIGAKLELVLDQVKDRKTSTAQGGARITLTPAKAHYPELYLGLVMSRVLKIKKDGTLVDEPAIRQGVLGYDHLCALGTQMDVYYERHILSDLPSGAGASAMPYDAPYALDGGEVVT
jgi:hypothetical protein